LTHNPDEEDDADGDDDRSEARVIFQGTDAEDAEWEGWSVKASTRDRLQEDIALPCRGVWSVRCEVWGVRCDTKMYWVKKLHRKAAQWHEWFAIDQSDERYTCFNAEKEKKYWGFSKWISSKIDSGFEITEAGDLVP
jgi:hypothetical protein